MEKYEVRFGGYRYNTPSNDVYPCVKSFENLNGVKKFINYILKLKRNRDSYSKKNYNFVEHHGIDYITKFIGLFKITITEEKIRGGEKYAF